MTPFLIFWIAAVAVPAASDNADTLVVCPVEFRSALRPWIDYRQQQGYKILIQSPASTSFGLREQIRQVAEKGSLKNVVLVGDAFDRHASPSRLIPTDYVEAKVNVKFGSEPEIATDNSFADTDGDGIVDLTIGRIPVDTPAELSGFVNRVIEYEDSASCGSWQRQVNFVAGVGGFGQVVDSMIEQSVKRIVTDLIPSEYDTTMTYGSWRSPFCPDPRRFSDTAIERFNEGCLFWVYVGHGNRDCMEPIRLPDQRCGILDNRSLTGISATRGTPIAIMLSCYTAAIDDDFDGLGENMLKQENGPIAVIGSSRVSMPYGMCVFSLEMIDGYFDGHSARTLGELILQSKQRMFEAAIAKSELHQLIDSVGQAFSPEAGLLHDEKMEHLHLMHLLGDPLLKLPRPDELKIQSPPTTRPGETITVSGIAQQPGKILVDLSYRRDRFRIRPPRRRDYVSSNEAFNNYQSVYQQSQNLVCSSVRQTIPAGPFSIQFEIPADCSGECHIRALLTGNNSISLGSNDITIVKK